MEIEQYFDGIERNVKEIYEIATLARSKGFDPKTKVEISPAKDLAGRVEGLVGPEGISEKIRELMKKHPRDECALIIIDEIMKNKDAYDSREALCDQCIRTSLAILTEGVAVASTEGVSKVRINKNSDGSEYLGIYFSGPIRAAGATAAALAVVVADYTRKKIGLGVFRPTEEEIGRYVEEVNIYHNSVSRLQYLPKDDEIELVISNCPVQINGEPTSTIEVSIYRDLERIETNMIRGGACLVIGEGFGQKAPKILKFSKKYNIGWDWLEGLVKIEKKSGGGAEIKPITTYLMDIVGGRPIFSSPSSPGGFRLRYGRSRDSGLNARSIHPATMYILDEFPAIGTQLKVERPGKGTAVTPCDSIKGPVVRLENGDVVEVNTTEEAEKVLPQLKEILFLGDMLVCYGDFLKSNHPLIPGAFCEEWWSLLAKEKGLDVNPYNVSAEEAMEISEKYDIPLHPKYTYFYGDISKEELVILIKWLKSADFETLEGLGEKEIQRIFLNLSEEKRILEKVCIPHKVRDGKIIIDNGNVLIRSLGLKKDVNLDSLLDEKEHAMEIVNEVSDFKIYNKAPSYIGARMGRPEKARERMMTPAPHSLTPVGAFGGKTRSVEKAAEKGKVSLEVPKLVCPACKSEVFGYFCRKCGVRAELLYICNKCGRTSNTEKCIYCKSKGISHSKRVIDMKEELKKSLKNLHEPLPPKLKGVLGMTNVNKYFEPIEKGILRGKHRVYVFKDGTIRFDSTDLTLTHFKPKEIGISLEKIRELGYYKDHLGNELLNEEQILELKPQDILIAEKGADYIIRVSKFTDDLLEKFYGLDRFYNINKKEELAGQLVIGIAPHISAGVIGRIIGFTKARATYAHPYYFCAQRRDSDGDECSIMLLMDALLNFSLAYLPSKTGGTMDAPLVVSTRIDPLEVDDQVHDMDIVFSYPLEFYEASLKNVNPADVKVEIVSHRLGKDSQYYGFGFTHDTSDINEGPTTSTYAKLKTMGEKVDRQLSLAKKIRAVDEKDVAARVLNFHFLRDIYGNLRSFGQQKFRCVDCNMKYRRVPLIGKCTKCGGKILLTVHKGGIEKYLKVSQEIAEKYGLSDYLKQRLTLIEKDLESIFEKDKIQQISLTEFM